MLVDITITDELMELKDRTLKPVDEIIEEILAIHLDPRQKKIFIKNELKDLFQTYKKIHGLDN
jgi:hypothetical protein